MATQRYTQRLFNRLANGLSVAGDVATSFAAVEIKCDPTQQMKITDISGGYQIGAADISRFIGGYIVGYLNYTGDINTDLSFPSQVPFSTVGDIFYFDTVDAMGTNLQGANHTFQHMSRPIVITGDRKITFILGQPAFTGGAASQSVFFNLEIFGEVTQIQTQEHVRYGPYEER